MKRHGSREFQSSDAWNIIQGKGMVALLKERSKCSEGGLKSPGGTLRMNSEVRAAAWTNHGGEKRTCLACVEDRRSLVWQSTMRKRDQWTRLERKTGRVRIRDSLVRGVPRSLQLIREQQGATGDYGGRKLWLGNALEELLRYPCMRQVEEKEAGGPLRIQLTRV